MTLYLSGAISSDPNYKDKFAKARKRLEDEGYNVLSPTMINPKQPLQYWDYIAIDFMMIAIADGVYFLKDWKSSPGAKTEHRYALKNQKSIFYEE